MGTLKGGFLFSGKCRAIDFLRSLISFEMYRLKYLITAIQKKVSVRSRKWGMVTNIKGKNLERFEISRSHRTHDQKKLRKCVRSGTIIRDFGVIIL